LRHIPVVVGILDTLTHNLTFPHSLSRTTFRRASCPPFGLTLGHLQNIGRQHRQPSPSLVDTTRGGGSVSGTRSSKLIAQVGSKINFAAACRHRVKLLLPISVDLVPCMSLAPQVCSRAARKAAPQQKCDTGNCFFLFSAALVECAISCDSVCSLDRRPSRAVAGCPVAEAAGLRSKAGFVTAEVRAYLGVPPAGRALPARQQAVQVLSVAARSVSRQETLVLNFARSLFSLRAAFRYFFRGYRLTSRLVTLSFAQDTVNRRIRPHVSERRKRI